ncbi:MAG: hypothetical protein DME06_17050 [Candidatus Rokuibacteriota bacterium]|nr:MAG: hypothetical protein DME06_17050 [Candidatus Rokubacteria bacterium]
MLTFLSVPAWSRIKMHVPDSDVQIRVTAKQFNWEVTYPGPDGLFDTADDRTFDNEIHFDAVPGHDIPQWFEVTKPGKYEVPCAELCGFGHSGMRGWAYAHTPEDYAKWLAENVGAPAAAAGRPAVGTKAPGKGKK